MFIDLNVPIPPLSKQQLSQALSSKKGKNKLEQDAPPLAFTPAQVVTIESRIDLLVHLGYTVLAFNQTLERKIDPKTFVNTLDPLLAQLRKKPNIVYLKRLTIVLDEESEKGFGLTNGHAALVAPYDLLALAPTTAASFSLACLTHTQPSPLTTHIIALPLTLPRLPFNLRHTLVRTALANGAVFEINYAGALGADGESAGGGESNAGAKRNWWAAAREVARVTKGKGVLVSGGVSSEADLRAPRDVATCAVSMLGVAQDVAHAASTKVPQSLILRAQTRKTYRAVFSEPKVVIPQAANPPAVEGADVEMEIGAPILEAEPSAPKASSPPGENANGKKRALIQSEQKVSAATTAATQIAEGGARKKKRKNKLSSELS
ncbi:PHP domain-like protein [Epithele typhae]|uniref:PHP domain-like protein n=1 Tax=Epithele typhae TaxID=378194 RepID=UPI002008E10B|nr:PHP domain-like protein [Epithele typhae]KAH9918194.1 PHP domain-like protein [Epithele typhae]